MKNTTPLTSLNFSVLPQILILVVISIVIRIPFFQVPITNDEGGYAYIAYFWSDQFQPYRDVPFDRLQGLFLIYKFIIHFLGTSIFSFRFFAALYSTLTMLMVYQFSKTLFKSSTWLL